MREVHGYTNNVIYRLVGGAGQVKITKDGNVLLHEMVIISIKTR